MAEFMGNLIAEFSSAIIVLCAHTDNFKVWRFHLCVGQNEYVYLVAQFNIGDFLAFFVEQEGRDRYGHNGANFLAELFLRFFFDQAQYRQRQ